MGFASLIMQKSHSKLAKFNTLVLKQYATLGNQVGFNKSITPLLSINGTYVNLKPDRYTAHFVSSSSVIFCIYFDVCNKTDKIK